MGWEKWMLLVLILLLLVLLVSLKPIHIQVVVAISYVAPQAHGIVNVSLHREYSLGIIIIFSQGSNDLYHV
jgi:hypothetical protein